MLSGYCYCGKCRKPDTFKCIGKVLHFSCGYERKVKNYAESTTSQHANTEDVREELRSPYVRTSEAYRHRARHS